MLGRVFNRSWHRHRFFLHYGHLASSAVTVFGKTADGVPTSATRGWYMPRAGWIISHTATIDVTVISGGNVIVEPLLDGVVLPGLLQHTFDTVADGQTQSAHSLIAFSAGGVISVSATAKATVAFDELAGVIEIEMER